MISTPTLLKLLVLVLVTGAIGVFAVQRIGPFSAPPRAHVSAVAEATEATSTPVAATTTPSAIATTTPAKVVKKAIVKAIKSAPVTSPSPNSVTRIEHPYSTAPITLGLANDRTRAALVNILCTTSGGLLRPISGSGVLVSPYGVILTNAHVAQYVLLSESTRVDFHCYVRTGSPATAHWIPRVLYIPPVWVQEHARELTDPHPIGTGEHDYALLSIAASADGSPLPSAFPYLTPDTRDAIGFVDDAALVASYPAEFLGGLAATNSLYSASSPTSIKQVLTFGTNTIDALSLGGVIEAQSGSSGGAVVNAWGYLIGLITTTSEGATTAERNLRAITISYINTDLRLQAGTDLETLTTSDPLPLTNDFTTRAAPALIDQLLKAISTR